MAATGGGEHRCARTGLVLVDAPDTAIWRVFRAADGPLNPPIRSGSPDKRWGRFDVPDTATAYGATHPRGAFIETLAALAPAVLDFSALFDDVAPGADPAAQDWLELHHMPPGSTAAHWRRDRELSELRLRRQGRFVDVTAADTIAVLRRYWREWAPNDEPRHQRIDTSDLTGPDRVVTCAVAGWLRRQVLDDGSAPVGVRYLSKHGGDLPCWAVWVDLSGTDSPQDLRRLLAAHFEEVSRKAIAPNDPDFLWAARSLGLATH